MLGCQLIAVNDCLKSETDGYNQMPCFLPGVAAPGLYCSCHQLPLVCSIVIYQIESRPRKFHFFALGRYWVPFAACFDCFISHLHLLSVLQNLTVCEHEAQSCEPQNPSRYFVTSSIINSSQPLSQADKDASIASQRLVFFFKISYPHQEKGGMGLSFTSKYKDMDRHTVGLYHLMASC